jgi:hypothetical protein
MLSNLASAAPLRCNNKLVQKGDGQYKFLKLCGEPDFVKRSILYRSNSISAKHYHSHDPQSVHYMSHDKKHQSRQHGSTRGNKSYDRYSVEYSHTEEQQIEIENWTYNFGSSRLLQEVRFVDGVAVKISNRGYGFSRY